jgi:hypothetical protein
VARPSKSVMDNIFEELEEEEETVDQELADEEEEAGAGDTEKPHPDLDEETEEDITKLVKNPRKDKTKQEETHQRKTFLIEKDLLKWMQSESKRYGHGFYVDFVNASLKLGKKRYEKAKKAKNKSK